MERLKLPLHTDCLFLLIFFLCDFFVLVTSGGGGGVAGRRGARPGGPDNHKRRMGRGGEGVGRREGGVESGIEERRIKKE